MDERCSRPARGQELQLVHMMDDDEDEDEEG
jgi:hypothetical protein